MVERQKKAARRPRLEENNGVKLTPFSGSHATARKVGAELGVSEKTVHRAAGGPGGCLVGMRSALAGGWAAGNAAVNNAANFQANGQADAATPPTLTRLTPGGGTLTGLHPGCERRHAGSQLVCIKPPKAGENRPKGAHFCGTFAHMLCLRGAPGWRENFSRSAPGPGGEPRARKSPKMIAPEEGQQVQRSSGERQHPNTPG